jgi:hypothetical protein
MAMILKHAWASRPSGEWRDDDYDALAADGVVGRIIQAAASPEGMPWLWTLAHGRPQAAPRLRSHARGGGLRLELAAQNGRHKEGNHASNQSCFSQSCDDGVAGNGRRGCQ